MSEPKPAAPPKPPRSAVERAVVWGVIGIGLLVIVVEANAHLSHTAAHQKLQAQLDDTLKKDVGLTKKTVDQIVGNKTPETRKLGLLDTAMAAASVDIYSYPGLLRSRKLYVYYGVEGKEVQHDAEVMEVTTVEAPTAAQAEALRPPVPADVVNTSPPVPGSAAGPEQPSGGRPQTEDAAQPADAKPEGEAKPEETKATETKPEETKPAAAEAK